MRILLTLAVVLLPLSDDTIASADLHSPTFEEAALYLAAVSDFSDIPEDLLERLSVWAVRPLNVNRLSRSQLRASGLFTHYQTESLLEYRRNHGDILSSEELAMVDGFNPLTTRYMAMFLSFLPGYSVRSVPLKEMTDLSATTGASFKISDGAPYWQWRGKVIGGVTAPFGRVGASFAVKSPWEWPLPPMDAPGWSVSYASSGSGQPSGFASFFKECVTQVIAGHFNARFGQGLAQWSGASFQSFTSVAALMKNPSGISPYTSWSPSYSMYGGAFRLDIQNFSIIPFLDVAGGTAGGNFGWNHRNGQAGVTLIVPCMPAARKDSTDGALLSLDFQHTARGGIVTYGEVAAGLADASTLCRTAEALIGVRFPLKTADIGIRALYSMQECNFSTAFSLMSGNRKHIVNSGSSLSYFILAKGQRPAGALQFKTVADYTASAAADWTLITRISATARSWGDRLKIDCRQDARWQNGVWNCSARVNLAHCHGWAALGYVEGGYKSSFAVYVQTGLFRVDDWADRIYVYRRDAPQSFNVPAMYGRGYWLSAFCSAAFGRCVKLYFRTDWTAYPWAREGDTHRRPSLGAGLQCTVTL